MSSSDTPLSSLTKFAGNVASWGLWAAKKSVTGPLGLTAIGASATGKWLFYSTAGRMIIVGITLLGTFGFMKSHFAKVERGEWEKIVVEKQHDINERVEAVEAQTAENSRVASLRVSTWDSIVALVVGGIWRSEPQDPVEGETVDLINETRGTRP